MVRRPSRLAPLALPLVRVQEAAELVALDVFNHAEGSGERITLATVQRRLIKTHSG